MCLMWCLESLRVKVNISCQLMLLVMPVNGRLDGLHAPGLPHGLGGEVGVGPGPVPVSLGLGFLVTNRM